MQTAAARGNLHPWSMLVAVAGLVGRRPVVVARALALPWLLGIAGSLFLAELNQLVFEAVPEGLAANRNWSLQAYAWFEQAVKLPLFALLAVKCHRLVLVPQASGSAHWLIKPGTRELRYTFWSFVILMVGTLLATLLIAPLVFLPAEGFETPGSSWLGWLTTLSVFPGLYVFARLGISLPAIAVGRPLSWGAAWQLTRQHQWSIFLVAAVLPHLLQIGLGYLIKADWGVPWRTVIMAGNWLIAIIALLVLSVVYTRLVSQGSAVHNGARS